MKKVILLLVALLVVPSLAFADESLFERAKNLYDVKEYESAKVLFTKDLEVNAQNGEVMDFLGWCNRYLGDWESAVSSFNKAIELLKGKESSWAHVGLGETYLSVESYSQASQQMEEAISLSPDDDELVIRALKGLLLAYAGSGNEVKFSEISDRLKAKSAEEWAIFREIAQTLLESSRKKQQEEKAVLDAKERQRILAEQEKAAADEAKGKAVKIWDTFYIGLPVADALAELNAKKLKFELLNEKGMFGEEFYGVKYNNPNLPDFVRRDADEIYHTFVAYKEKMMKFSIVCVFEKGGNPFILANNIGTAISGALEKNYGEPIDVERGTLRSEYAWRGSDSHLVWLFVSVGLDRTVVLNIQYVDIKTFLEFMEDTCNSGKKL